MDLTLNAARILSRWAGLVMLLLCGPALGQPAAVASTQPSPPAAMVPIAKNDAATILGRPVLDAQGDTAGRITDVLVDAGGQVRAAVVDVGGFLGVGQRRILVAWPALTFDPTAHTIRLSMGAPEVAAAPEYRPDADANVVATPKDSPKATPDGSPLSEPPAR